MNSTERMEQKRVNLADLIACGEHEGYFVRWPNETKAEFGRRLTEADDEGSVAVYMCALSKGDRFPPVIVARRDGELFLADGWHRCAAAAILNHKTISAVVFEVTSFREEDLILELAFNCFEAGMHWTKVVRVIKDRLELLAASGQTA